MTNKYSTSDVYNMPLEQKIQKGIFIPPVLKRRLDTIDKENAEMKALLKSIVEKLSVK